MRNPEKVSHLEVPSPLLYKFGVIAVAPLFLRKGLLLRKGGVTFNGLDNLPGKDVPYILAANHRSLRDVPAMGQVLYKHDGTQIHFVTKKEITDHTLLGGRIDTGKGFVNGGAIRYDRDLKMSQQPETAEAMSYVLRNNGVLGMFSERTRREGRKLQVEEKGLGYLAVTNSAAIATLGLYVPEDPGDGIFMQVGKTSYPGELATLRDRRRRMVDMEAEYQDNLQEAMDEAYGLYERAQAA